MKRFNRSNIKPYTNSHSVPAAVAASLNIAMPKSKPRTRSSTKSASVRPRKSKRTRRSTRGSLTRLVLLAPMQLARTVLPTLTTSGLASTPVAEAGFKPTTSGSLLQAISPAVYRCTVWCRQLDQAVHSGDSSSADHFICFQKYLLCLCCLARRYQSYCSILCT